MHYVRLCIDKPGAGELREAVRAEHRDYLKPFVRNDALPRLVLAGPLCVSDIDDTNLASFMIIEAERLEDVLALHEGDPFTKAGLYAMSHVHRWDKHIDNTSR